MARRLSKNKLICAEAYLMRSYCLRIKEAKVPPMTAKKLAPTNMVEFRDHELMILLHGQSDTAQRLIDLEKIKHPGQPESEKF